MVGFDGASWPLVERWAADGHLPALAGLIERGTRGRLQTPDGFNDNAVWASFATSLRPERHGWLHYNRVRPGGYDTERVTRDVIEAAPFWQAVSDGGHTVTVIDVPKAPRGVDLHGVELVDWLCHGADSPVPLSEPADLVDRVVATHGPGHPRECLRYGRSGDELVDWVAEREEMTRRKGDLLAEQVAARDADLFLAVFNASHCVGHQCWHLHDPEHADHDPAMAARTGDPLLRCYSAIDRELARLLTFAAADATVIAFACLGMGPHFGAGSALDRVLLRLDPATPPTALTPAGLTGQAWRRLVPLSLRRAMPSAWHRAATKRAEALRERRSYFPIDTGARSSGIRVNLAGREAAGVITPGEGYESVLADLETALSELVDDETGVPVVGAVERTADHHEGPHAGDLPDLFVHWAPGPSPVRAVRSDRVGVVLAAPPDRTGHHHAHGFFVAAGPGLAAGRVAADAHVVDLSASVAARLGVELGDVDGTVIAELSPDD